MASTEAEPGREAPPSRPPASPRAAAEAWLAKQWSQLTLSELSGSLGDLGVFIPFLVGLAQHVGLDVGTTLIGTGIYNVVTGAHFGIPMPVQPMKNIGAVAIAEDMSLDETLAAGVLTSAWVLFVGATRFSWGGRSLVDAVCEVIPAPLVKGIQMGLGLSLARKGLNSMVYSSVDDEEVRYWFAADGLFVAVASVVFAVLFRDGLQAPSEEADKKAEEEEEQQACGGCDAMVPMRKPVSSAGAAGSSTTSPSNSEESSLASSEDRGDGGDVEWGAGEDNNASGPHFEARPLTVAPASGEEAPADSKPAAGKPDDAKKSRSVPVALVLLLVGLVLVFATRGDDVAGKLSFGPSEPEVHDLSAEDFRNGFLKGALPQIPLTTLNSIVAVSALSYELYGDRGAPPSTIAMSVSLCNLAGLWFGVMPVCHGAGGLAAQHRFGARHGTAPIFLGVGKIVLGLLFGSSLRHLLDAFPETILGAMLLIAGVELAITGLKQGDVVRRSCYGQGYFVLLFTAVVALIFKTFIGFAAGCGVVLLLELRWRAQRHLATM
uniref:SLC26A/SulP transporter domain-containing protein n=1 Tax=Phaeomonas parva TaxID=124430 RepID=A0A7S1TTX2_9STRA|mmetsp:Transcript_17679/g.54101  ORF Transcript_17679/g.54101 Transcript_17679/m.54101 type:complete len:548 (+) Transcript_17679:217-1860(+)|eukprot:CAMPEP_0118875714 /NCGR_PEP_ID=MMETSP1163-20130328/16688_1 /TAXON_ID=124430 /ORGANISM="Phaeomonas parva, Strain CCMP2877" /LENGTH=547 /DNA_ID=CAMNT_0006811245 /DNA_START=131 /DNA_END=1774 /DNA_ORIENTATION=-